MVGRFNEKLIVRVPRASSLSDLKQLIVNAKNDQKFEELFELSKFKNKSHFEEYKRLLIILGVIYHNKYFIYFTNKGVELKSHLSLENGINAKDREVLTKEFLKLELIRKFLKNVFQIEDVHDLQTNKECLSKEDITKKYLAYRQVKENVAERESRAIYNWLVGLELIEPLQTSDNRTGKYNLCYHIIGKKMDQNDFSRKIKQTIFKAITNRKTKSDWIEIPVIRNMFCIEHNLSKNQFNDLLLDYINKNPDFIQLSTGTSLRNEVEQEGIRMGNKLFFYIRLVRGL